MTCRVQTVASLNVSDFALSAAEGFASRRGQRIEGNVRTQFAENSTGGLKTDKVWYKAVALSANTTQTFNFETGAADESGAQVTLTKVRAVSYRVSSTNLGGTPPELEIQFPQSKVAGMQLADKCHGVIVTPTTGNSPDGADANSIVVTCPSGMTGTGTLYLVVVGE